MNGQFIIFAGEFLVVSSSGLLQIKLYFCVSLMDIFHFIGEMTRIEFLGHRVDVFKDFKVVFYPPNGGVYVQVLLIPPLLLIFFYIVTF